MSGVMSRQIQVELPCSLRTLAGIHHDVHVCIEGLATQRAILDALESMHPALQGTIRDRTSKLRRPFIRFFACQQDLSHAHPDDALPDAVADGAEPFLIVGAIAGG
jgi:molybdopterin synthase sulfur carrier subunit